MFDARGTPNGPSAGSRYPESGPVTWSEFRRNSLLILFNAGLALTVGCSPDVTMMDSPPEVAVHPGELHFVPTRMGREAHLTLEMLETSARTNAVVREINLSGDESASFEATCELPLTIPAGGEKQCDIRFRPTSSGEKEASLTFIVDRIDDDSPVVLLEGTALSPDLDGDGQSEDEGDCDDSDGSSYQDAPEHCDGLDNDCDGIADNDALDALPFYGDLDGDAYGAGAPEYHCEAEPGEVQVNSDCDDANASVYPSALEVCDELDNDCDGEVDEDATDVAPFYFDIDLDGYGAGESVLSCEALEGTVGLPGDCDDESAAIYPNASELCNGVDDDCDGEVDEGALDAVLLYPDADGDGYGALGASSESVVGCEAPGWGAQPGDCDDGDVLIHPGAEEICDERDQDCDGESDEGLVLPQFFRDEDGDTFGSRDAAVSACVAPSGYVLDRTDCDDSAPTTYPGSEEVCDRVDQDCDGEVDEGLETTFYYVDKDLDGFGATDSAIASCASEVGRVTTGGDCDDSSSAVHPDALEVCNGVDEDCDGEVDEGLTLPVFFPDGDGDGYGETGGGQAACAQPEGLIAVGGDCDDHDVNRYPGATERCNSADDDCDGEVDEGLPFWSQYPDQDGDGYGATLEGQSGCSSLPGLISQPGDCDDTDALRNPAAQETCNEKDDDCDGSADEGLAFWLQYLDADGDGFGVTSSAISACRPLEGRVPSPDDCDDTDASRNPASLEVCNGRDDDCDGVTDDGLTFWLQYPDQDMDGFGVTERASSACMTLAGMVTQGGDCDDTNASRHPGAEEVCNEADDDCDGQEDEGLAFWWQYPDQDGDHFGVSALGASACRTLEGTVASSGDCDDRDAQRYPGALEVCNQVDDDCDGLVDNLAVDASSYYPDSDGDGFGDEGEVVACEAPSAYVTTPGDCDDLEATTYPGALERCNGRDDDCDGSVDEEAVDAVSHGMDQDEDGYAVGPLELDCEMPPGHVEVGEEEALDCDDLDPQIHPGALETCDGNDYNCDGIWQPVSCDGCHVGASDPNALYPSIQAALDSADLGIDFGGEIRVCAGTYYENLRFNGSAVRVRALEPGLTILDGSACTRGSTQCSTVSFRDGEGAQSGLSGFIVRGGRGTQRGSFQTSGGTTTVGGGILVVNASPTLTSLTLSTNQASQGAGFFSQGGSPTLIDVSLTGSGQSVTGGGLYLELGEAWLEDIDISNFLVTGQGAGLYADRMTSLSLARVTLANNHANNFGGGAVLKATHAELFEVSFTSNLSDSAAGGGLYVDGGTLIYEGGSVTGNRVAGGTSSQGGGGIYLNALEAAELIGLSVSGNQSAGYGGGLSVVACRSVALEDSSIASNTASSFGGGLSLVSAGVGGTHALAGNRVLGNRGRYGGGLYADQIHLEALWETWVDNESVEFGAALYQQSGTLEVSNSKVLSNVGRQGGGFYLSSVSGTLANTAFVANSATEKGSGLVLVSSASVLITSSIVSHGSGVAVVAGSGQIGSFRYNDVYGGTIEGFVPDSSNIALDPMFVTNVTSTTLTPESWDLHLKPASPCIDRGDPALGTDPNGSKADMGAYGGPLGAW